MKFTVLKGGSGKWVAWEGHDRTGEIIADGFLSKDKLRELHKQSYDGSLVDEYICDEFVRRYGQPLYGVALGGGSLYWLEVDDERV